MSKKLKVTINETEILVKEYQGQRVVTLKEIDTVHERQMVRPAGLFTATKST